MNLEMAGERLAFEAVYRRAPECRVKRITMISGIAQETSMAETVSAV